MEKTKKYEYKSVYGESRKLLVCPKCYELLFQTDIEHYSCCPFCDYQFAQSPELEDYLLEPVVRHWIRSFNHNQIAELFRDM